MSYLALARKWRPRTFSQLVGQEHVCKPLVNALNQNRLHHAYIFTGTRGVGKTSVARILAKALDCEVGISSTPCLNCDACLAIEQGRFTDLIEVDGASKTKVEDTRDLLDNVQYAPTNGRFKIYLIDEVHMLSQHNFNALLKTFEEPPSHVKFILATTDPQKLPITVLSRCLQFNLNHLPDEAIKSHLQYIIDKENMTSEEEALAILAHAAQGSMRDALSLLDQAIVSGGERLLASEIKSILGYTQQDYALQIISALAEQNASILLSISNKIIAEGGHFHFVLNEILSYLHQICIYQAVGTNNPLINPSSALINLATRFSPEDIQLFYQIGIKGREEINLAPTLAIGFNMTLLRMLTFRPLTGTPPSLSNLTLDNEALTNKKSIPESQKTRELENSSLSKVEEVPQEMPMIKPAIELQKNPSTAKNYQYATASNAIPSELSNSNWPQIIKQLKMCGLALTAIENTEFINKRDKIINLKVAKGHFSLFTPNIVTRIQSALSSYFNDSIKLNFNIEDNIQTSPAQQKGKKAQEIHQQAITALQNDEVFQQLQKEFSAEVVKNSIVPLKCPL